MTVTLTVSHHPLQQLRDDRALARTRSDPMANVCSFATVSRLGAEVRTLVLRDIGDQLAVFYSATSPKAKELSEQARAQALIYLPSVGVQYRLWLRPRQVARELLEKHWPLRPIAAKQLDWLYNLQTPQSAPITDRVALRAAITQVASDERASMTTPPPAAIGCFLDPDRIERLRLDDSDPPHDRRLYELVGEVWRETVLVP